MKLEVDIEAGFSHIQDINQGKLWIHVQERQGLLYLIRNPVGYRCLGDYLKTPVSLVKTYTSGNDIVVEMHSGIFRKEWSVIQVLDLLGFIRGACYATGASIDMLRAGFGI